MTNREIVQTTVKQMTDEEINFLHKLLNIGNDATTKSILNLCDEGDRPETYDTATPVEYMREIEQIYPESKNGNYIFDYSKKSFGELTNINNIFFKAVLSFVQSI